MTGPARVDTRTDTRGGRVAVEHAAQAQRLLGDECGWTVVRADGPVDLRRTSADRGGLRLERLDLRTPLHVEAEPGRDPVVVHVAAGRIGLAAGRAEHVVSAGGIAVLDEPYALTAEAAAVELTVIGRARLAAAAGCAPEALRFLGRTPTGGAAAAQWTAAADCVRGLLATDLLVDALVMDTAADLLAAATVAAFPTAAAPAPHPTPTNLGAPRPRALRRALAHIEENADGDVTVADVARAAGVSPRAIQQAFRRHLDTTPIRYLRRVRLDAARRELRRTRPEWGDCAESDDRYESE
jgi:AraC-like DNA-binding protein